MFDLLPESLQADKSTRGIAPSFWHEVRAFLLDLNYVDQIDIFSSSIIEVKLTCCSQKSVAGKPGVAWW